jgi:hypothetical protein
MDEMISYCGLNCQGCQIYLATREKDKEKKYKMRADITQQIKEHYGQEYKPEDISDCDGCKTEGGRLFSGCNSCYMRKCARKKHIENCAYCEMYPCEELEKLFTTDKDTRIRLDAIKSTI